MKNIIIIAAVHPQTLAIGNKGELLFSVPEDMAFFKNTTMGAQIVVGRRTWDSIPNSLPGRDVFVLTKNPELVETSDRVQAFTSVFDVIQNLDPTRQTYVIGGAQTYEQFMPYTAFMLITLVDRTVPEYDTTFPTDVGGRWVRKQSQVLTKEGDVVVHLLIRDET